jgi:hypothetical protein
VLEAQEEKEEGRWLMMISLFLLGFFLFSFFFSFLDVSFFFFEWLVGGVTAVPRSLLLLFAPEQLRI